MSYQYLGQNSKGNFNYKLTLSIYRDCQQSDVQFDPVIKIGIYHNNSKLSKFKTVYINLITKKLVSPPGNTNCGFKPSVCIEEGFYEGIIEVEPSTIGYHLSFVRCCRNKQNNLKLGNNGLPDLGQTYYCFIPPTNIQNSSPVFKGVPSPYMCANDTTSFLNTAVDQDGDSLVYYFVKPFDGGSPGSDLPDPPPTLSLPISTVVYKNGFSEDFPFGNTGYSNVDRFNGLTTYFTNQTGNFVVAIEVAEYRNGVLLSTVRLDLQIIFIDCPPNRKPTISSDKGKSFTIEAGSKLCFNVISTDADNDALKLTPIGDIFTGANNWKGPKATLSAKTGVGSIVSEFCWQTSCDQASPKPYQFAVKVEDDGCPGKFNAVNFTIKIDPFISNATITGIQSICQNSSAVYQAGNLAPFSTLEWDVTNGIIVSGQGTKTVTVKWTLTPNGKLRLRETSQYGCKGDWKEITIQINSAPPTPLIVGPDTVCLNSTLLDYSISNFTAGNTAKWKLNFGVLEADNNSSIKAGWNKLGNQVMKVVMVNSNGCVSDTAFKKINVRKPQPAILGPASICPNAKGIEYNAFGTNRSTFTWNVTGGTIARTANANRTVYVNWGNQGTGVVTVTETDRFGCVSNAIGLTVDKTYTLGAEIPYGKNSVCEFEKNVLYKVFPSAGTTFKWTVTGSLNVNDPGNNGITVDWGKAGNGLVSVVRTAYDSVNNRQCVSLPGVVNVVINPTPNANTINGDFDLCQLPDSISYTLNGYSGSKYMWRLNGSGANISGQGTKTVKFAWNTPGTFTLDVIELSKDSCWGTLIDTLVVVYPKPVANTISGAKVVCNPNTSSLGYKLNGLSGSTYNWTINNGSIISGAGTDSITVSWNEMEPAWLKVVEISAFGCAGDTVKQDIVLDNMAVELWVVSVGTPDDRVELSWKSLSNKPYPRIYDIQRRKAGDLVWQDVGSVTDFTNYIDQPVNTDLNAYEYRIKVKDLCSVDKFSDNHTDVLVTGSKTEDPYTVRMDFTNYLGFKNGVKKYVIYRRLGSSGPYVPYDSLNSPSQITYKNGLEGYLQCYRILSFEDNGNQQQSWSNDICFNFSPTIYVPNAFTPNNDGINDLFEISSGAIKSYEMKVFNRWGERLWSTTTSTEFWDGTYKGEPVQMDVYMYVITLTDFRDHVFSLNGTVHVIR